ncbi:MAG TPA: cytochrome P450 [Solirubrobacterales bacterium]|jgi:cytochrome P450|nr:cytochrome P450 [Solirubrobacterales bacterium]
MEQATIFQPPVAVRNEPPPGSRAPALLQALRYVRDPLGFLIRLQRRHGDIFSLSFPYFGRLVYVADPTLVKQLFTGSPEQFHAGEANATVLEPALGPNSVLTLDDGAHMRQRKLLLPPFHGEQIRNYGELIREITLKEMRSWPVGEPFALRPHTQRITLAVIMQAVFGVHDEARLARFGALIETFSERVSAVLAFPMLRRNLGRWSPWPRFQRARAALDEFIYEEIELRRVEMAAGEDDDDDVLSLLLDARYDDGSAMSDEELRDELVTVLGAGHETTATGLAWAMERLLRTPRVLAKLRESLAAGDDDYLEATVKETLRARPVIVDVARKVTAPAEIGGYELPAGTFVMAAIAALHYREDLFPQAQEFRPERFLEGRADNYAWIPFGGGVRRCIGAAFAEYEMRIVLREIVEGAELSAPDPEPEKVKVRNITLAPGKGTVVRLDRPLR